MKNFFSWVIVIILVGFIGCGTQPNTTNSNTAPTAQVTVPDFNSDSAYAFVSKQVDFGPRNPNSTGHEACLQWMKAKLDGYADQVILQPGKVTAFDGKQLNFTNVIASFNPKAGNRILLAAHWDTRPWADQDSNPANHKTPILGANDGASGVGVLIEVARMLKQSKVNIGVDLVLFDVEDYGQPEESGFDKVPDTYCLGSQYWAKNPHVAGYQAKFGILLDMVGGKGSQFRMEGSSTPTDMVKTIWNIAIGKGYGNNFMLDNAPGITDDHVYVTKYSGVPMLDIIHLDPYGKHFFHPVWHTMNDNMESIDKNVLKAVGQTLLEVLYREDKGTM